MLRFLMILTVGGIGSALGPIGFLLGALVGYLLVENLRQNQSFSEIGEKIKKLESQYQILKENFSNKAPEKSENIETPRVAEKLERIPLSEPKSPQIIPQEPIIPQSQIVPQTAKVPTRPTEIPKPAISVPVINKTYHEPVISKQAEVNSIIKLYEKYLGRYNPMVIAGILVLFFAAGFILKYAVAQGYFSFPIEVRLMAVAAFAIGLFIFGLRSQSSKPAFAVALQGGSAGILYITVLAAYRGYSVLPPTPAFIFLAFIAFVVASLSIKTNSQIMAVLGTIGGFLAPLLVSQVPHTDRHVSLFSYMAILNSGIFAIAWKKSWRFLSGLGFIATSLIAWAWGMHFYTPAVFSTTEPFLILFFFFYLIIQILFSIRQKKAKNQDPIEIQIWILPIVAFAFQNAVLQGFDHTFSYSALGLGLTYLLSGLFLTLKFKKDAEQLIEHFLCIATVFLAIACPGFFSEQSTSAIWAIAGAGLFINSLRRNSVWESAFGIILQIAAGCMYLYDYLYLDEARRDIVLFSSAGLGAMIVGISAFISAYKALIVTEKNKDRQQSGSALLVWGFAWIIFNFVDEIRLFVAPQYQAYSCFGFGIILLSLLDLIGLKLKWKECRELALLLLPLGIVALIYGIDNDWSLGFKVNGGIIAWPLYLLAQITQFKFSDDKKPFTAYCLFYWLLTALTLWEVQATIQKYFGLSSELYFISGAIVLGIFALALILPKQPYRWQTAEMQSKFLTITLTPLIVLLVIYFLASNFRSGSNLSVYLPIFNILDLGVLYILAVLGLWIRALKNKVKTIDITSFNTMLLFFAFMFLNAIASRAVHHCFGIRFDFEQLIASAELQTTLSVLWSSTAVTLIMLARKTLSRDIWIVGAGLLLITVGKLFLFDLSNSNTIARIISFLGVGGLLLIVGYFAPIPPVKTEDKKGS